MDERGTDQRDEPTDAPIPVRLWDAPVRLVHWSFVLLMPWLWWTYEQADMELHKRLGYIMLALLVFRIFWGFAGSTTARFSSFLRGPRAIARYLGSLFGKEGEPVVGHNPVGGWSAMILLGLMVAAALTGLITQDVDGLESGPLTPFVDYETADAARGWHELIFNLLLGMIAIHVAAILFYLIVKRENLVGPMISGRKRMAPVPSPPAFAPAWRAIVGLLLGFGVTWWVSLGCPLPG